MEAPPATDYYENTPRQRLFVESLKVTRIRQSRDLLRRTLIMGDDRQAWLDFGCGRGWFLEEAQRERIPSLAGFDASELSTGWLKDLGFLMAKPKAADLLWPDWSSLPFSPRVISFLDVIEHFQGESAEAAIRRLIKELPELKYLVIKVPSSEGILFRIAKWARRLAPGLYEQLFQVGTFPPHFHYFSKTTLRRFVEKCGLEIVSAWSDPDVDNVFHRIPSLSFFPGGRIFSALLRIFPADSEIVIARVGQKDSSE